MDKNFDTLAVFQLAQQLAESADYADREIDYALHRDDVHNKFARLAKELGYTIASGNEDRS